MTDYGLVRTAVLTDEEIGKLYESKIIEREIELFGRTLLNNEYVIVKNMNGELVDIFKKKGESFIPINPLAKRKIFNDYGASKNNYEQMCLIDAYFDDEIELIFCEGDAGTGKSFVILMCALADVLTDIGKRHQIIYTREIVESGREIGFLPGDAEDKTKPYFKPAQLHLEKLINRNLKDNKNVKKFEKNDIERIVAFEPLQHMRGTTYEYTVMINDEAQNESLDVVQMFCTRAGEGSKVILAGSYKQIDDRKLSEDTNGMYLLKIIMAGLSNVACVRLTKQERSRLAQLVDEKVWEYKQTHSLRR